MLWTYNLLSVIQGTKTPRYNLLHYLLPHNFNSFFHCTTKWNQRSQKATKILEHFLEYSPNSVIVILMNSKKLQTRFKGKKKPKTNHPLCLSFLICNMMIKKQIKCISIIKDFKQCLKHIKHYGIVGKQKKKRKKN